MGAALPILLAGAVVLTLRPLIALAIVQRRLLGAVDVATDRWNRPKDRGRCRTLLAVTPVADDRRERFEALAREAYVPLLRYLRRRTDAATADDVLGDTLLVLWRRFDDVPAGAALPWCFGVARGCLANRARGEERHRRLLRRIAHEAAVAPAEPSTDPALEEAFERLPERDREVLRLWAWEGLAPQEIAVVLGVSANAASIRLHRATRRLRDLLGTRKTAAVAGHVTGREGTEARP